MSTPARKVVIFRVEACGTIDADTPEAEIDEIEADVFAAVQNTLSGQLGGLSIEVDRDLDARGART